MKLRIVHLLLLQSVMLLLSCSNQSRKNMDTSAEPADSTGECVGHVVELNKKPSA